MPFTTIWERYFLREFLKMFFFVLLTFYGLYVLIDYANHSASFHRHHVAFQWKEIAIYYACEFVKRLDVLIPFVTLIATIRTLCTLNAHLELIALLSSGQSLMKLMRPFFIAGIALTAFMYVNTQYLIPTALKEQRRIDDSRSRKKQQDLARIQSLALDDGSILLFKIYDDIEKKFIHAYWIRSFNDIYRFQELSPNVESKEPPKGTFIQHIVRNGDNELYVKQVYSDKVFPEMIFNQEVLFETVTQPEELSFSDLWEKYPSNTAEIHEKESQIVSIFYQKLMMPWLCLLAVLAPAPFCLRFSRYIPVFFIYACSIFGLVTLYLIIDSAVLLGKRQVLDPLWLIWVPFALFSGGTMYRFLRIRTG